jgi:hypothetical protein
MLKADDSCSWFVYQNLITMYRRLFFYKRPRGRYNHYGRLYTVHAESGLSFADPYLTNQERKIIYTQFTFLFRLSIFFKTKIKRVEAISL